MFSFNELNLIQVEITSRCQASCPMCARNINGGPLNPKLKLADWTLSDFKNIFNLDVLQQINCVNFCGSFGDPIMNNDIAKMLGYLKTNKPNIEVRIHTNGSLRNKKWWQEIINNLPENHLVTFGIDGLEDTHSIHRIGTSFKKIIDNARSFIDAGGNAEWMFIKFKHNEHQIDLAQELAEKYKFVSFIVKNSIRFTEEKYQVIDKNKNNLYTISSPSDNIVTFVTKDVLSKFQDWFRNVEINCQVLKTKEIYIDAYKIMYPCCWIASTPHLYTDTSNILYPYKQQSIDEYNDWLGDIGGIDELDLNNTTIKDIMSRPIWNNIWKKYWGEKKLLVCAKNCGTSDIFDLSKPKDQVVKNNV